MKSPLFSRISLPVWILAVGTGFFILPWQISKLISDGTWANPDQFAAAIQSGFLMDLDKNINTPGYGGSFLTTETKFWFWFHLSKAFFALLLLALIILYKKEIKNNGVKLESKLDEIFNGTLRLASNLLALFVFLILCANIQGTIAPLSSLISFLPANNRDPRFNQSISNLRENLQNSESSSFTSSVLRDFSIYHLSIALIFGVVAFYLFKNIYSSTRARNYSSAFGIAVLAIGFLLLGIANMGTGLHPVPAFDGFLSEILN